MDVGGQPHTLHPDLEPILAEPAPKRRGAVGFFWLLGIVALGLTFGVVARYFDPSVRLSTLIQQKKVLPLHNWQMTALSCPTFYADLADCKTVKISERSQRADKLGVTLPLKEDIRAQINSATPKPNLLHFTHQLTEYEKDWLSSRTTAGNPDWPTQSHIVSLGSLECEARESRGEDFDPSASPEKLSCFTQTRFERMEDLPAKNKMEYFIAIGENTEFGPARWPLLLAENQRMHELLSLDQLTLAATVVWNLISLLVPIFVIAFRFVFRNERLLTALADYAIVLAMYSVCIIVCQQAIPNHPTTFSVFNTFAILLEGIILVMMIRYTYCAASGRLPSLNASVLISLLVSTAFAVMFSVSQKSPAEFLVDSHKWRDLIGSSLAFLAIAIGVYSKSAQSGADRLGTNTLLDSSHDEYGTRIYFAKVASVTIPLLIFGTSNLKEIAKPSMQILKWEDLLFLPSQTALIAFLIGAQTSSSLKYGKSMRQRLEALFSGILNLQRSITQFEAIQSTISTIKNTLPAAESSEVEYLASMDFDSEQISTHLTLENQTLFVPLQGSSDFKGILMFNHVQQESLSEEEEHVISTISSALALNIESQESAAHLEEMHQASLRFVPHDFLLLLKSESLVDFNLGDHVEVNMSVMFADIRNFTQISEGMTPSQNFEFINGFLTQIAPVIKHHGGFIDKYIGDAIMALFPKSPVNAARCAIDMQIALRSFNDRWLGIVNQEVRIGIGIHYGPMILGIVGYAERLSSTVMSDAVNLASRLESLTKKYECDIIVSEDLLQNMSSADTAELNLKLLDSVVVRGRNSMVTIYQVVLPVEQQYESLSAS